MSGWSQLSTSPVHHQQGLLLEPNPEFRGAKFQKGQVRHSRQCPMQELRCIFKMCLCRGSSLGEPVFIPGCTFQIHSKSPSAFTLRCSSESHIPTFAFLVTGTIQVARRLDRDAGELRQNPTISLEVLVKDRPFGGQENRVQITFIVEDINDNPAACSTFTFRYSH